MPCIFAFVSHRPAVDLDAIDARVGVVRLTAKTTDELYKQIDDGLLDGVTTIAYTGNSVGGLTEDFIKRLPSSVKFVVTQAAGYDNVPVQALTDRGILLSHNVGDVDNATSTTALHLLLSSFRLFDLNTAHLRKHGRWDYSDLTIGRDPEGKCLGIYGLGGIGKAIARRAAAFDMRVIYHNRKPAADLGGIKAEYKATLDEILDEADAVVIAVPLSDATRGKFDDAAFAKMRKGSIIVNIARGPIINEDALLRALDSGHLFAAGLDVFESEPEPNPEIIAHPRITCTPHAGTFTADSLDAMYTTLWQTALIAAETGKLRNVVPEQQHLV